MSEATKYVVSAKPLFGKGGRASEAIRIGDDDKPLPELPSASPERDPRPLAALAGQRAKDRRRLALEQITDGEYTAYHSAKRVLERFGFDPEKFDCPYAIEQRYSARDGYGNTQVFKIVDDVDGQIKGAQIAHKKEIVGREYSSDAAAYTALKRKGYRASDPKCPYKIVKLSPISWRIETKITPEESRREALEVIRSQLPLLSMPENQETTMSFIVEKLEKIFSS
jgi:hypothetical protein